MASRLDPRTLVACIAAGLLAILVYLNALHNPFVYDDYHLVVANASIEQVRNVRAIVWHDVTRPIVNFSYAIDRAAWGARPLGFHVTNVLLHALNVMLLLVLARRMADDHGRGGAEPSSQGLQGPQAGRGLAAFAAAALFATHPMMTEAVGYISGRSEVLCATFFLLALLSGRRWLLGDGMRWPVLTVGFWIAGLATKESAAMFPFVLVTYDRLVLRGGAAERRRRLLSVHLPLVVTALVAGLVRLTVLARVEYPGRAIIHWPLILLDLDVVRRYVELIILPVGQTIFHEVAAVGLFDAPAFIAVGVVVAMGALAWRVRRIEEGVSFGILWFLLLLVPSSALILLNRGEPMAEHRVYLASCGLFLSAGSAIAWLNVRLTQASRRARPVASVALAALLLSFGAETLARNAVWGDPVKLWRESVDLAPTHFRPRLLLGEALQDAGRREEAAAEFRTAIRLRPDEPTGYVKLGLCLAQMARLDEAAASFRQLRAVDPRSAPASNGLGTVALLSGQPALARHHFLEAIEMDPGNVPARQSLVVLDEMEPANPADALRLCEEIQRLAPEMPGVAECIQRNRGR